MCLDFLTCAVLATTKVPNLKANHNKLDNKQTEELAVLATTKVPNLNANHNRFRWLYEAMIAVLATTKVPNLKANHNDEGDAWRRDLLC